MVKISVCTIKLLLESKLLCCLQPSQCYMITSGLTISDYITFISGTEHEIQAHTTAVEPHMFGGYV